MNVPSPNNNNYFDSTALEVPGVRGLAASSSLSSVCSYSEKLASVKHPQYNWYVSHEGTETALVLYHRRYLNIG